MNNVFDFDPQKICPHPNQMEISGKSVSDKEICEILDSYITQVRKDKFTEILENRTYSITSVLENFYDMGNINAIVRSSEAFGIMSMHLIRADRTKSANRITSGAHKWCDFFDWDSTPECISSLKKAGYKVATTSLASDAVEITELDFTQKWAFVFGNEHIGVSEEAAKLADVNVLIPSVGFTQSFNVSVAAAICLQQAYSKRKNTFGKMGDLTLEEKEAIRAFYYIKSIKYGDALVKKLFQN
ncbi:MAG: RNA methyltransferase [Bacteriovoracaceae bacterium]|jgi:tRNA (guanosine-2'-O-)-methyltransferase|nr:RNA methyltransferase [Bacteriovoracaceae bacterium]